MAAPMRQISRDYLYRPYVAIQMKCLAGRSRSCEKASPHHPGLGNRPVVPHHHDPEQQIDRLFEGERVLLEMERLSPWLGSRAGVPVQDDQVGLLAWGEITNEFIDIERLGSAERDRPE